MWFRLHVVELERAQLRFRFMGGGCGIVVTRMEVMRTEPPAHISWRVRGFDKKKALAPLPPR